MADASSLVSSSAASTPPVLTSVEAGGVFPSQWIRAAIADGIIKAADDISLAQIQPNSMDLRLGDVAHQMRCSFLPGHEGLDSKLNRLRLNSIKIDEHGTLLSKNQPYIFPLKEHLNLAPDVYARANPKSTTGRLDIFTRLVTQYGTAFDEVPAGYQGPLYLEVVPRSFSVRVRPGDALAQIRFQTGDPHLSDRETSELLDSEDILFSYDRQPLRSFEARPSAGLVFSIGLSRKSGTFAGYLARKNTPPIDLRGIGEAREAVHWSRLKSDGSPVILEPDDFYLFRSRELVRLPPRYCAEMVAFDAGSGEIRTHYAGFFDSGFGYSANPETDRGEIAAAVVLEVRSRDVPFLIEDGQPLFRVHLMRCMEEPDLLYGAQSGSSYQSQGLRLPKQFSSSSAAGSAILPPTQRQLTLF